VAFDYLLRHRKADAGARAFVPVIQALEHQEYIFAK
jgi:hypothetical protein